MPVSLLAAVALLLSAIRCFAHDVIIEVDPGGVERLPASSAAAGNRLGPVRSLAYAVSVAREVRRARPVARDIAIAIILAPGVHRLDAPVRLGPEDSGAASSPLVIRGSASGDTLLRGSVAIAPDRTGLPADLRARVDRLNAAVRAHVGVYRMPPRLAGVSHIDTARPKSLSILVERFSPTTVPSLPFEVFDEAGAMRPAQWPNTGWGGVVGPAGDGWWSFTTDAPRSADWRGEPDLWTGGYWKFDYSYERHHVREVDDKILTLSTPFVLGLKPGARFHAYHALAELDEPGEWYRDHANNILLAWPRGGTERPGLVEVSIAPSAIVSEGASHVRIENLTIERFFGDGVRVVGGRDVVVEASTIRWTGMHGASFVDARDSGIASSDIADTGEGGVLLSGGDRTTLSPAGLFVRSCSIVRFARIGRTFKPAVDVTGVGNIVSGNFIAEAPNFGVQFQGNDHLIEGNEITDVVNDTTDSGAIYTGKDWTAQGSVVRHNFLHDLRGGRPGFEVKGVYLDDFASGIVVTGNLFLRVEQPVFIGGGRDNLVEGNLFIASAPAIHVDARGLEWAGKYVVDPSSDLRQRLAAVPFASQAWRARYPRLAGLLGDDPGDARRNVSRGNVMVGSRPAYRIGHMADARKQSFGPDLGTGDDTSPVGPKAGVAMTSARSASEVGSLLAGEPAARSLVGLPLAAMDRTDRAGRLAKKAR